MDNYSWEVTFNLPKCLKQTDLKTFDEDYFIIEEDNTINCLNKWKELTEEER